MTARRFIEFVPLFNFNANIGARLDLDNDTWLAPLDEATRSQVVQAVDQPNIVISRNILASLHYGLYHRFTLLNPTVTEPPNQDLELDVRLIFKVLQPDNAVTTGYSAYYSEEGQSSGGRRMASEFRWPGPTYELHPPDALRLPGLWRELREIMSPTWLWGARFFHTSRIRLWRASHEQDRRQRLIDLFIVIESLLLRETEQWGWLEKGSALPFGPRRLTILLDPTSKLDSSLLLEKVRKAREQRNIIAHGIDRDIVGFDGTIGTFDELAREVECWTPIVLHRMVRLLYHAGSKDAALDALDALASDPDANGTVADRLLAVSI